MSHLLEGQCPEITEGQEYQLWGPDSQALTMHFEQPLPPPVPLVSSHPQRGAA